MVDCVVWRLRYPWSHQCRLHVDCIKWNISGKKYATWNKEWGSEDVVIYPSVCGYKGVWEDCLLDEGKGDVEYTCVMLWWWHISEESKVAVPLQAIWES